MEYRLGARDFLSILAVESWANPPLFDHSLVARLIEADLVTAACAPSGAICYEITGDGSAAVRHGQQSRGPPT